MSNWHKELQVASCGVYEEGLSKVLLPYEGSSVDYDPTRPKCKVRFGSNIWLSGHVYVWPPTELKYHCHAPMLL